MSPDQLESNFRANLDSLISWARLFFDSAQIEKESFVCDEARVLPSRRSGIHLDLKTTNGLWLSTCSPVDPAQEAASIFESEIPTADVNNIDHFIIIGFEAGYLLETVSKKCRLGSKIILWEPSSRNLRAGLSSRLIEFVDEVQIEIYLGADSRAVASMIASLIDPLSLRGLRILCNQRLVPLYGDAVATFSSELRSRTSAQQLMLGTTIRHGETFFRNFLANIPFLTSSIRLDEIGRLIEHKDCLLISAGPSIETQLSKVSILQRKMPLLCVGPVWKTLRASGIRPDLVFSIDPFRDNYTHFDGLDSDGEILVSDLANNHDVVSSFKGSISFFHTNM